MMGRQDAQEPLFYSFRLDDFGNLVWPTSAVCSGPPFGTLMLRVLGSAGA